MKTDETPDPRREATGMPADPPFDGPPVRIALVGAGIFVRDAHLPSLLRLPERFQIVAIYSRQEATAAALAQQIPYPVELYTDLAALLARDDIEAVDVALPIPVMPGVVARCLAAGKHVISEKPIAPDVAQGQALLAQRRQHPTPVWMVGENWRYEEAFLQAARLIREGAIGRPLTCHWAIYTPITANSKYYHTTWRRDSSFPGGFILDGGIHHVAALRLILGEIEEVTAALVQNSPALPPADTVSATLRFENGVLGAYLATYATGTPWPPLLHIAGELGCLRVQRREVEVVANGETRRLSCAGFNGVEVELAAFADAIRLGRGHRNPPEEALQDLAVMEAILRAAEAGRAVTPPRVV